MNEYLDIARRFFVESTGGHLTLGIAAAWFLGSLSATAGYRVVRAAWGRACYRIGVAIDATLGSKLGRPIWNPLEKLGVDFLGFGAEQACAGLRKNDIEALADQHERLVDVGSVNRAAMVKTQLVEAAEAEKAKPDPAEPAAP